MTSGQQRKLMETALEKYACVVRLVEASLQKIERFDSEHSYAPNELEPYDALSDRFIRAVEVAVKFFRSYERYQFAEESDVLRDLLNRMEKLGMISAVDTWFQMRDVRNRIVHDYVPEKIKEMYDDIIDVFGPELIETLKTAVQLID